MYKKKLTAAVMAAVMVFGCAVSVSTGNDNTFVLSASAAAPKSGSCGPQAYFILDDDGTLTISGNGLMYNWPWDDTKVKKLVVNEGLDYISFRHFKMAPILESISLPSTMKTLRSECFMQCPELKEVNLPKNLNMIESNAFQGCDKLKSVTVKSKEVIIGEYALGYTAEKDGDSYKKVEGFTIYGYTGSTAEGYAKNHGFAFVPIDSREEVRGDVNNDTNVDIEDAVMVINNVNGQTPLDDPQFVRADIDGAGVVDIEDAVNIINHVNGVKVISPAAVKVNLEVDDEPVAKLKVSVKDEDISMDISSTGVINTNIGRGSNLVDPSTYGENSWYFKVYSALDDPDINIANVELVCEKTGLTLQEYITNCVPITENVEFTVKYDAPSGQRTMALFDKMLDNNYSLSLEGDATVMTLSGLVTADIKQMDENNGYSKAHADLDSTEMDVISYTKEGTKYYIKSEADKKYSTTPGFMDKSIDMQNIFESIASNKDNMKFLGEETFETGFTVEKFKTDISVPMDVPNAEVEAYYNPAGELKKLVIMDPDFDPAYPDDATLYISTTKLTVETEFDGEIAFPDFSEWTKV